MGMYKERVGEFQAWYSYNETHHSVLSLNQGRHVCSQALYHITIHNLEIMRSRSYLAWGYEVMGVAHTKTTIFRTT